MEVFSSPVEALAQKKAFQNEKPGDGPGVFCSDAIFFFGWVGVEENMLSGKNGVVVAFFSVEGDFCWD